MRLKPFSVIFTIALSVLVGCVSSPQKEKDNSYYKLWYQQPANAWEEALPLGNGDLGVMVFGKTDVERLQLNGDAMWPGDNGWSEPDGTPEDLKKVRELIFKDQKTQADELLIEKFSNKSVGRSHQTMGDLWLDLGNANVTDYKRELDLKNAIAKVSYKVDGKLFTEKIFVSNPDKAIIVELSTEADVGLNGKISMSRPKDKGHQTVTVSTDGNHTLLMDGEVTQYGGAFNSEPSPIKDGVKFQTRLEVKCADGTVMANDSTLELKGAKNATLYIVSNNSFYTEDFVGQNKVDIQQVMSKDLQQVEEDHITDYQHFFSRVHLDLGRNEALDTIPTDVRLQRMKDGSTDVGMEELLFHYGRYLLIGSSREGTLPANLQGLWNEHIEAPWNGDYHLNINLQMNYWLANVTNLDELNMPLFDYVDRLVQNGQKTAKVNYSCNGAFIPHATDIWAPTWMRAPTAYWGGSFGAAGWMLQHYWQHYEYTEDEGFLENRLFPALTQVATFYSDWLVEDPRDGYLVAVPSTSPENAYYDDKGNHVATCAGSAMDHQVIEEVFNNYIKACELLGVKNELLDKVTKQLKQLRPGWQIASDGRVMEWDREYKEAEPGHRHMSHLYGFHPGTAITEDNHPELWNAIKKTLDYRLANGGAGTGWSRAWLINLSARLKYAQMAHDNIQLLFTRSMYNNLFDAHPPFQIDGNFGFTAGVAEMLEQSHAGYIEFLPALPKEWSKGSFEGLKARGNVELSATWDNMKLQSATLTAVSAGEFKVKMPKDATSIELVINGELIDVDTNQSFVEIPLAEKQMAMLKFKYN